MKTCSNCGQSVSFFTKVGDYCPHCETNWTFERTGRGGAVNRTYWKQILIVLVLVLFFSLPIILRGSRNSQVESHKISSQWQRGNLQDLQKASEEWLNADPEIREKALEYYLNAISIAEGQEKSKLVEQLPIIEASILEFQQNQDSLSKIHLTKDCLLKSKLENLKANADSNTTKIIQATIKRLY